MEDIKTWNEHDDPQWQKKEDDRKKSEAKFAKHDCNDAGCTVNQKGEKLMGV